MVIGSGAILAGLGTVAGLDVPVIPLALIACGLEEAWLAEQFAGCAAYRRRTRKLILRLF